MAPNRGRNRQSEFDEFAPTSTQDFDPEGEVPDESDEASDLDQSENEFDGREHYVDVGKSKLRKPKDVALGPQYRGSKVDRNELESDEDGEDFLDMGFDEEDSELEDASDDGTDDTDLSDEEEESVAPAARTAEKDEEYSRQLKQVKDAEAQSAVARSLSQANQEEAEKGRAVKKQRTGFDALLNTRMKLQKSLIATNTLVGTSVEEIEAERQEAQEALEAAETAAFQLWTSLNKLREDLLTARTGTKRKRSVFSVDTSTEDMWTHIQSQETESRPHRDAVLKKWSAKSQGPSVQTHTGRLNQTAQTTIIDVLQEQLTNNDRLMKKAHAPRSCAPLQLSKRIAEDAKIYDDADFYGLLLKELLEQKSADSVAASNIDLGLQIRREAKTKRNVDTKASKGRKLRYTVHEKLQNFMAPEDRTRWGERQADELFGSLFGQRMALAEKDEVAVDEEMDDGVDAEEAGLLMFGN